MRNLLEDIDKFFVQEELSFVRKLGELASQRGDQAYLVGGLVRDFCLGIPSSDFDIMFTTDAREFVEELFENWEQHFPKKERPKKKLCFNFYRTGKLFFKKELFSGVKSLDFSTARTEVYPVSAKRPEIVFSGSLAEDLARRDFSINAMALSLNPSNFMELLDPQSGLSDLEKKELRIFHTNSFRDDPARMLRAIRFLERFGFSLEKGTAEAFAEATENKFFLNLSEDRLLNEFKKASSEKNMVGLIKRIKEELVFNLPSEFQERWISAL